MEAPRPLAAETAREDAMAEALQSFVRALGQASRDVQVTYRAGVATLSGAVLSETQRQAIEDLVSAHEGIERVENELRVAPPTVIASGG